MDLATLPSHCFPRKAHPSTGQTDDGRRNGQVLGLSRSGRDACGAAPLWRTMPRAGAGARMPSSTIKSLGERALCFRLRLLSNPDCKISARASCHVPTADGFALGGRPSPEHATHMSSTVHNNIVASDRSTTGLLSVSVLAVGSERKVDCKANMA